MISKFNKKVIEIIKQKRIETGLSQSELALLLGVSSSFIGKIESPANENTRYNLNHINNLAQIFHCSPRELLPDESCEEQQE